MSKLKQLYTSYCNWVFKYPSTVADIENAFTWASMAFCAKSGSQILPELLYSASNIMILLNDIAVLKKPISRSTVIKITLSVVEYCEILFEVIALSKGHSRRLAVIFLIQIIKCIGRLLLIKAYDEFLISNPPFEPLNREEIDKVRIQSNPRRLRTYRQNTHEGIIAPKIAAGSYNNASIVMKRLKTAEIIFTLKPLLHLLAMCQYGEKSWIPWLLSLKLDIISNSMRSDGMALFPARRNIILQRYLHLFIYLLRSPLYEFIFQMSAVVKLRNHLLKIPFFGILIKLILNCVPKYRYYYFYLWSH